MCKISALRREMTEFDAFYISSKANIFYYSGFSSEDAKLVITETRQALITDSRYFLQAKKECPDFEIFDIADGLESILKRINFVYIGYEEEYLSVGEFERLKKAIPGRDCDAAGVIISKSRRIKSKEEIDKIRCAEELGDAAFSYILNKIREGMTEREVAYLIEDFMKRQGALKLSFETIVASGVRSAMPHGTASDKIIAAGDFVTMDFGCVLDGYCSDMTRTVVMKRADERQKEIYALVLKAQSEAINSIKVGLPCKDIDRVARDVITAGGYGGLFLHSLGHSLGLEIHEQPNFSPRSEDFVEIGNVITVEPGIYIEGFGGVRIEDVVAITPEKALNLTKSKKELIII